jgi:hypothetical protein
MNEVRSRHTSYLGEKRKMCRDFVGKLKEKTAQKT